MEYPGKRNFILGAQRILRLTVLLKLPRDPILNPYQTELDERKQLSTFVQPAVQAVVWGSLRQFVSLLELHRFKYDPDQEVRPMALPGEQDLYSMNAEQIKTTLSFFINQINSTLFELLELGMRIPEFYYDFCSNKIRLQIFNVVVDKLKRCNFTADKQERELDELRRSGHKNGNEKQHKAAMDAKDRELSKMQEQHRAAIDAKDRLERGLKSEELKKMLEAIVWLGEQVTELRQSNHQLSTQLEQEQQSTNQLRTQLEQQQKSTNIQLDEQEQRVSKNVSMEAMRELRANKFSKKGSSADDSAALRTRLEQEKSVVAGVPSAASGSMPVDQPSEYPKDWVSFGSGSDLVRRGQKKSNKRSKKLKQK